MKEPILALSLSILCAFSLSSLAQPSTSSGSASGSEAESSAAALMSSSADDRLRVSTSPTRGNAQPLEGAALSGEVYIFFEPLLDEVEEVIFYLNDVQALRPLQVESVAPFDFAGSREEGAYAFNVSDLSSRENVITAKVTLASGEAQTLSAAFVAEGVQEAFKADYYVASGGSDDGEGSLDDPFGTLTQALSVVQAGERIQLRGGVYKEYIDTTAFELANGQPGAPITIESYPGEMAVIDGDERHWSESSSSNSPTLFRLEKNVNWFVIQNLTFRNSAGRALHIEGSHNVVRNVTTYKHHSDGVYILGDNNLLEGIVTYGNYSEQNGGDSADGIKIAGGDQNVLRFIRAFENSDDGIDIWRSTNTLVEFCLSYENGGGDTGDGAGFKLGSRLGSNSDRNATIRYNIAYKNRLDNFYTNGGSGVTLLHNTSWQAGRNGFMFRNGGDGPNVAINNVSYEDPSVVYSEEDVHNNNSWNLGIDNPRFTSLNPDSPDFLRLQGSSPAVDAGARVDLPYSGPEPDLGALEHGQEVALGDIGSGENN